MKMQRSNARRIALAMAGVALMIVAIATPAARASITFVTPSGSNDTAGDPVSASATFTVTSGSISITLTNLQTDMKDAGQLLSDLQFTVSNGSLSGSSLSSSSGNLITVHQKGSTTAGSTGVSTGWAYSASNGELNGLNGKNKASRTIIGPANSSGTPYPDANSSIAGNGPHNPFLDGSATFTIAGTGITSSTTIASATFSFGTASGDNIDGVPVSSVPEPSTMALAGLGAIGFLAHGLRRRLKS
jgi:hypothetical protein